MLKRRLVRLARRAVSAAVVLPLLVAACSPAAAPAPLAPPLPVPPVVEPPLAAPVQPVQAPAARSVQSEEAAPVSPLQAVLDEVAARNRGRIGVVVKNLKTGETAELNGHGQFRAASLYKLFVLESAFARMASGGLSADEGLRFGEAAFAKEPYAEWPAGTQTTVDCALQAMITVSHNAASAMLIDRLGGEGRITDEMWQLGMDRTLVTEERAYTSPHDVAGLLEQIWRGEAVSPAASKAMLTLLSQQQRNDRVPLPLPAGVAVAHKTGELAKLRHDAGIVFAPSGPYVLVAMVQDAPSDAAARTAIVDLSRTVYAYFEDGGLTSYEGLPPRLAPEIFQTPDERGRLKPLSDEWAQTVPLARAGVSLANGANGASLRDVAVPDLVALQRAATNAGARFWVTAGYRAPSGADWAKAAPNSVVSCRYELPPAKPAAAAATPAPTSARPAAPPAASQYWLGTVAAISDSPTGEHTVAAYAPSFTGSWLLDHAWEYGFVPALPESKAGAALGYEPWTLRWVGREMAAELHGQGAQTNPGALAALREASRDAAALASANKPA